jgi:hypothetical protein
MDGWLPPRAPGANPPPRFDAAPEPDPPPDPPPAPAAAPAATPPGPAQAASAPHGWQPPAAPASPRPAATPAPTPRTPPRGPQVAAPAGAARPNPAAVWALVLGISGLVLLLLSLGTLFLITLPCSAGAWILARRASSRIAKGETGRGAGQVTAALWVARIGVMAGVVAMVAFIVLTASGFDFEQFRQDLERDLERRREGAR